MREPNPPSQAPQGGWRSPFVRWVGQGVILFALWLALSGHFELEFVAVGIVTAVLGVGISSWLFHGTHEGEFKPAPNSFLWLLGATVRFLGYLPWLAYEIVTSNLHVIYLVLHPRMPVNPDLVEFVTSLESEHAQVLLAQSITLTPGTVTVDATDGRFLIHCLSDKSRQGIAGGSLQRRVARVFSEYAPERVALRSVTIYGQVL